VGGLSHYFEEEGLPTTQISLIREHTEAIKPPRALWVPFELGRPLGVPNDPTFQTQVLMEALQLLESSQGPVLKDFSGEEPFHQTDGGPLACPVDFSPSAEPITEMDQLLLAFRQEFSQMRSWYDLARQKRGRTTSATSGIPVEELVDAISGFVKEGLSIRVASEVPPGTALKMAVEDLKAYYLEAVTIQPGQPTDSATLADWFWARTAAARVIGIARKICAESTDSLKGATNSLIPRTQLHRFES